MTLLDTAQALGTLDDRTLVARARAGDATAFDTLAGRYRSWLVARCRRQLGGDHHEAEDVAQECLLKAHAALLGDTRPLALRSWLSVVARHACVDRQRRRRPDLPGAIEETAAGTSMPAATGDEGIDPCLEHAWTALNERHRSVLYHREIVGLSYEETARAMGTTLAAVESLLFRARRSLRQEYGKAGGRSGAFDLAMVASLATRPERLGGLADDLPRLDGAGGGQAVASCSPEGLLTELPGRITHFGQHLETASRAGHEGLSLGVAVASIALVVALVGGGSPPSPEAPDVAISSPPATVEAGFDDRAAVPWPGESGPATPSAEDASYEVGAEVDEDGPRRSPIRRLAERVRLGSSGSDGPISQAVGMLRGDGGGSADAEAQGQTTDSGGGASESDDAEDGGGGIRELLDDLLDR